MSKIEADFFGSADYAVHDGLQMSARFRQRKEAFDARPNHHPGPAPQHSQRRCHRMGGDSARARNRRGVLALDRPGRRATSRDAARGRVARRRHLFQRRRHRTEGDQFADQPARGPDDWLQLLAGGSRRRHRGRRRPDHRPGPAGNPGQSVGHCLGWRKLDLPGTRRLLLHRRRPLRTELRVQILAQQGLRLRQGREHGPDSPPVLTFSSNRHASSPGGRRRMSKHSRRGIMKFLLTSAGISNDSIRNALVDLLGKPIAESSALYIPTALHAKTNDPRLFFGSTVFPLCEVGWKSLGVLELTALPSIDEERWLPLVQETDALLVEGGDPLYLCYWMQQSGLADLLPELPRETVYVGLSAGSMVMAPSIGEDFVGWKPPTGGDRTLGLVDFAMFPHLHHPSMPENSMADAEKWAAGMPVPAYLIDDQTAIQVVDGAVEGISEGHWKLFTQE